MKNNYVKNYTNILNNSNDIINYKASYLISLTLFLMSELPALPWILSESPPSPAFPDGAQRGTHADGESRAPN